MTIVLLSFLDISGLDWPGLVCSELLHRLLNSMNAFEISDVVDVLNWAQVTL